MDRILFAFETACIGASAIPWLCLLFVLPFPTIRKNSPAEILALVLKHRDILNGNLMAFSTIGLFYILGALIWPFADFVFELRPLQIVWPYILEDDEIKSLIYLSRVEDVKSAKRPDYLNDRVKRILTASKQLQDAGWRGSAGNVLDLMNPRNKAQTLRDALSKRAHSSSSIPDGETLADSVKAVYNHDKYALFSNPTIESNILRPEKNRIILLRGLALNSLLIGITSILVAIVNFFTSGAKGKPFVLVAFCAGAIFLVSSKAWVDTEKSYDAKILGTYAAYTYMQANE